MRVAVVHNFHARGVPSGEDEVVSAEVAALEGAGLAVRLIGVWNDELERRPLSTARAATTIATGIGVSPLGDLDSFQPDVIHVHSLFPFVGHRWLRRVTAPVVVTAHSYRALCANGYLLRDGEVCTRCPEGKPWSGVRYGCYRGSRLATIPHAFAARRGAAHDPLLCGAGRVLVLSERAKSIFARAGVPEEKLRCEVHFLPERLDPGRGDTHGDAWLFVGRLTPEKGIDRLVAEWPRAEPLRILGEGPLRPQLERAASGKRIEFLGHRPRSDVMVELGKSFGLVFPSRWYETFGLVYIEALAAGVPTLAFRPNVVADAVEREGTGAVAAWGALECALASARQRFDALRRDCRRVFETRYTEKRFLARRLAMYQELARV